VLVLATFPEMSDVLETSGAIEDWLQRGVLAASLANAAGTLLVFLFLAIESRQPPVPETIPADVALAAICPRCNLPCTFRNGPSECPSCGLRVTLDIEEPRCPCGYLLYKLASDNCPECGRLIRRNMRLPVG
jgi:hypothetical protein